LGIGALEEKIVQHVPVNASMEALTAGRA